MARKQSTKEETKQTAPREKRPQVKFRGYLNYTVKEQEKQLFKEAMEAGFEPEEYIDDLLAEGYSLKSQWDSYNQAYTAAFYNQNVDSDCAGWTLSFRAATSKQAIARLVFIHVYILRGDWSPLFDKERDADW